MTASLRTMTWYDVRRPSIATAIHSLGTAVASISWAFRPSWHITLHEDSVEVFAFCYSMTSDA